MPIIKPPPDEYPSDDTPAQISFEGYRKVKIFMNVKPWKCPDCGLTNFGRNLHCADYRCKSPRPANFKIERRDAGG